jgi:uncharacterized protein YbjT (DUF2867 family)
MNTKTTTLVLGGTGKTGSRVAEQLKAKGFPVRIGSRSGTPSFDWEDAATWKPVLKDVGSVYISYHPDLAIPGAVEKVDAFTKLAVENGVKKLVLLSGRGEKEAQDCEELIMQAGVDWTIVRCSWFNQNFSEGYMLDPIIEGHVALLAGDVREPFVDVDDIADVAVAALTEEGHNGQLYELTGPRLLSFREAMAEISKATGREIKYEQVSEKQYRAMLEEYGVPEEFIWLVIYLFSEVLDGRNESLADGVQRALGRAPRDFSDYVKRTAATGVWNARS